MAHVVITLKLMPSGPSVDFVAMRAEAEKIIAHFSGHSYDGKFAEEPVGFGLKALKFTFLSDEAKGSTEPLEAALAKIPDVQSVEITDVRRAVG